MLYSHIDSIYTRSLITNKLEIGKYKKEEFEALKNIKWIGTEKVDGTNIRIIWKDGKLSFGGKTDNAQLPIDLINKLKEIFESKQNLFAEKFAMKEVILFGEGYGAGIQKGGVYSQTKEFVLFDVAIDEGWVSRGNVVGIAEMFNIKLVPVLIEGSLMEIVEFVKSQPKSNWNPELVIEGIVARPEVELQNRFGERVIVKIKVKDLIVKL